MIHHHWHHPARFLAVVAAGLCLGAVGPQVRAGGTTDAASLELRKIMRELDRNMQRITGAIAREDWRRVAMLAPLVAAHPQPTAAERARILAYLGTDAARFRGFDEQTHEAAHAMAEAAQGGDGKAVIQSFAAVQESCLACHEGFRKPFVAHFYGHR